MNMNMNRNKKENERRKSGSKTVCLGPFDEENSIGISTKLT